MFNTKDIFATSALYETQPVPERIESEMTMLDNEGEAEIKDMQIRRDQEIEAVRAFNKKIIQEMQAEINCR
jgi:hypothetical protein